MSDPQFANYFSPEERKAIADEIQQKFSQEIKGDGRLSNKNSVRTTRLMTHELVSKAVERIFAKQNIRTKGRDKIWTQKLLAPFDSCISKAKNLWEAQSCADSFKKELPNNIGLAVVHETAKEDMNDKYATRLSDQYKICVRSQGDSADSEACARKSLLNGVASFTKERITETQAEHLKDPNVDIPSEVMPKFNQCVGQIRPCHDSTLVRRLSFKGMDISCVNNDDIRRRVNECVESVKKSTAVSITKAKVLENKDVLKHVPDPKDRLDYAENAAARMNECLEMVSVKFDDAQDDCTKVIELNTGREIALDAGESKLRENVETHLKDSPVDKEAMIAALMKEFRQCLGKTTTTDQIGECAEGHNGLERKAAEKIGVQAGRDAISAEVDLKNPPKELAKQIEGSESLYKWCLKSTKPVDECTRNHAVRIANVVGNAKLKSTLGKLLGAEGLNKKTADIHKLEAGFQKCLEGVNPKTNVREQISACTADLQAKATRFASKQVSQAKSSVPLNAEQKKIKEDVVGQLVKGGSGAMTSGKLNATDAIPKSGALTSRENTEILDTYVALNGRNAATNLAPVAEAMQDPSLTPEQRRDAVIEKLDETGTTDGFIKALVYKELKDSLQNAKGSDRPDPATIRKLLDMNNFNKIFTKDNLAMIRRQVSEKVLAPLLLDGKGADSKEIREARARLQKEIAGVMIRSPHFGPILAGGLVSNQLKQKGGLTRLFAELFYGPRALDWKRVSNTPEGKKAEQYILENLVAPKIANERLSRAELARRQKIAEDMVSAAVQGRGYTAQSKRPSFDSVRFWEEQRFLQ